MERGFLVNVKGNWDIDAQNQRKRTSLPLCLYDDNNRFYDRIQLLENWRGKVGTRLSESHQLHSDAEGGFNEEYEMSFSFKPLCRPGYVLYGHRCGNWRYLLVISYIFSLAVCEDSEVLDRK
jgi:hypothetical protein